MKNLFLRITVFMLIASVLLTSASCGTKDHAKDYRKLELEAVDFLAEAVNKAVDITYPDIASANLTVTVSDDIVNAIGIGTFLGQLRSVSLGVDYATVKQSDNTEIAGGKASIILGDTEIAAVEAVADGLNKLYISLPGYSEKALALTLPEDADGINMYQELLDIYTDPELYASFKTLLSVALEQITNVEKIKTQITVGDVTQECNAYTYVIDQSNAPLIAKAVINELKTNQSIRSYIESTAADFIKLTGEELNADVLAEMDRSLDELLAEINDETNDTPDPDDSITYSLYTDNKDNIIGREFVIADEGRFFAGSAKNGQNYAGELLLSNDENSLTIKGDGTLVNNRFTGKCVIYADIEDLREISTNNEFMVITFEDYYSSLEDAETSGRFTLEFGQLFKDVISQSIDSYDPQTSAIASALMGLKLVYDFDSEKDAASVSVKVLAGELEICTISETLSKKSDYTPAIPAADTVLAEENAEQFVSSIDIMKILTNLQNSGIPAEVFQMLMGGSEY